MSARSFDFPSLAILHKPQARSADAMFAAKQLQFLRMQRSWLFSVGAQAPLLDKADLLPGFAANQLPGSTDMNLALLAGLAG